LAVEYIKRDFAVQKTDNWVASASYVWSGH